MFGKGAKRKLGDDEAGLEGKALETSVDRGDVCVGPEGLSKVSYTLQRQTIFNISLMKLYSQRPLGEPRLERRVLINNMLRRIQEELKREGSLRPLLLPMSPPPDDPMDEGFREAPPSFGILSASASQPSSLLMPPMPPPPPPSPHPLPPPCQGSLTCPHRPDACLTPASLLEDDCIPSPPTPPLSPSPVSQAPPRVHVPDANPLTLRDMLGPFTVITRTTSPSPSPTPSDSPRDSRTAGPKPEAASVFLVEVTPPPLCVLDEVPPAPLVPPPPSSPPSGFLSDLALDDVLFADIDTSMYDFDACVATAGAVGAVAGGCLTKMPLPVNADDLLKSLASPYGGSAPQVSVNQPFKMDLTELDHIMEVLVGS